MSFNLRKRKIDVQRASSIVLAFTAIALLAFSCNFLGDLVKSFEYSSITFNGSIRDRASDMPIHEARLIIDNNELMTTDSNGLFKLNNMRSGIHILTIEKTDYQSDTFTIDQKNSDSSYNTFFIKRKNFSPEVIKFESGPIKILALDDTIWVYFESHDSTGGILKAIIQTGDGQELIKKWSNAPVYVKDSLPFCYQQPGIFATKLMIIGRNNDTTDTILSTTIPANRKPAFSLVHLSQEGFMNHESGFLEIYTNDPDNNFHFLTIDWGDTSKIDKSTDSAAVYWHKYDFENDTSLKVFIQLYDLTGATHDTIIRVKTRTFSAPILDEKIIFDLHQNLQSENTSIFIGVRVLSIEGSNVSTIFWMLNNDDPISAKSIRMEYTSEKGKIDVDGNVFTNEFSIENLKENNNVKIIVADKYGRTSTISEDFLNPEFDDKLQ